MVDLDYGIMELCGVILLFWKMWDMTPNVESGSYGKCPTGYCFQWMAGEIHVYCLDSVVV
jgi:hypothetical protein